MLDTKNSHRFFSIGEAIGNVAGKLRPADADQRDDALRKDKPIQVDLPKRGEEVDTEGDTTAEGRQSSDANEEISEMEAQGTRTIRINGLDVIASGEETTPEELKDAAGIDPSRNLIQQGPDGNEILGDGQKLHLADGDYFSDAPTFKYG